MFLPNYRSYSLGPAESLTHQKIITIQPMMGIKPISCHQPLRPISCSLLDVTAIDGRKTAREIIDARVSLTICENAESRNVNNTHHQNSDRAARPLNSVYFFKQMPIDSVNVISLFLRAIHGSCYPLSCGSYGGDCTLSPTQGKVFPPLSRKTLYRKQ